MAAESGDNRSPTATRQPFASQEEECVRQYSASQEECLRCKCGQHVPHMISHYVATATTCGMFHVVAEL